MDAPRGHTHDSMQRLNRFTRSSLSVRYFPLPDAPEKPVPPDIGLTAEGEGRIAHGADVLDGIECLGIHPLDGFDHLADVGAPDDGEQNLDLPEQPLGVDRGHPVVAGFEMLDEFGSLVPGDNPDEHDPERHPPLDEHSYEVSRCESTGVPDVAVYVREVLHDLGHRDEPDEHLEEPAERREKTVSLRDENHPHGPDAHIDNPRAENERREDGIHEKRRVEETGPVHNMTFPMVIYVIPLCCTACLNANPERYSSRQNKGCAAVYRKGGITSEYNRKTGKINSEHSVRRRLQYPFRPAFSRLIARRNRAGGLSHRIPGVSTGFGILKARPVLLPVSPSLDRGVACGDG